MTKAVAKISIQLAANAAGLRRDFRAAGSEVTGFAARTKKALSGMGSILGALGIAGGLSKLTGFLKESFAASEDAFRANQKLESVLRATGGTAGFSADQMRQMATALQQLTGVEDDAIVNAEALLATFKNIRGDVFKQTLVSALDHSALKGADLQTSVTALGKALNDPIRGLTMLRKVGVDFTAAQRDMIRGMVAAGDVMGAQKAILEELEKSFGGAAASMRSSWKGFWTDWGNLKEAVGDIGRDSKGESLAEFLAFGLRSSTNIIEAAGDVLTGDKKGFLKNFGEWMAGSTPSTDISRIKGNAKPIEEISEAAKKASEEAAKMQKQFMEAGERMKESLRTPAEVFDATIADIRKLLSVGAIDMGTYERAASKAIAELRESTGGMRDLSSSSRQSVAAVTRGSTAAFSAIHAGRQELERQLALQRQQLKEDREHTRLLEDIKKNTQPGEALGVAQL